MYNKVKPGVSETFDQPKMLGEGIVHSSSQLYTIVCLYIDRYRCGKSLFQSCLFPYIP